jgi:hypothetical protein
MEVKKARQVKAVLKWIMSLEPRKRLEICPLSSARVYSTRLNLPHTKLACWSFVRESWGAQISILHTN